MADEVVGRGIELAAQIGARLGEIGWGLDPRRGPEVSILHARTPDGELPVDVEVVAGAGATVVSVSVPASVPDQMAGVSWR